MEGQDVGTTIKGYTLMEYIGGGSFGRVYKSIRLDSPTFFAIKVVKKHVPGMPESKLRKLRMLLETEIRAMKMCNSTNVVRLIERFDTASKIFLVLEFCDGPDLEKYMKQKGVLPEQEAVMILRQLACGFQELQRNKIIHRDLKPANIFSNAGEFKIGDLGFARVLERTTDLTSTMLGSLCYMAPEILQYQKYGFAVDIWSLGVVLHQMVLGKRPFGSPFIADFPTMLYEIQNTKLTFEGDSISHEMKELLKSMLTIDVDKRISWEELYQHPLLKKEDLLVSMGLSMPVVRRETSKEEQKLRLNAITEDVFDQLLNRQDDGKDLDVEPKQIAVKNVSPSNMDVVRKQFTAMEEVNRECKLYTEEVLFELSKLNLLLKYLVVVESKQLAAFIYDSRKLTELRLMAAVRCYRKSWAITQYFAGEITHKSEIASEAPPLFRFRFDNEYRKTPDFRNLHNEYRFIYDVCMKNYKLVSDRLTEFEDMKRNMLVDMVRKWSDRSSFEKKESILNGHEQYDYTEKEHTEFVMKDLHQKKDRVDKMKACKELYLYLLVFSYYPQLAKFGGDRSVVEKLKSQIEKTERESLNEEGWNKRIGQIKEKL